MAHIEKVQLNYLTISPRKVRLIGNTLKGMSVIEAQAQLMLRPQRAAAALLKLLKSAMANAEHNKQLKPAQLKLVRVTVDSAPVLKRSLPRAQGRATSIFKRMSHVTLIVEEVVNQKADRFVMVDVLPKEKKEVKPKRVSTRKASKVEQKADLEHSRPEKKLSDGKEQVHDAAERKPVNRGAVKRFFNRKAI